MKVTLLGTGTSVGIPMIGCTCKVCRSNDPRDKRLRVSVLIEHGKKNILIDTSADFRQQMLAHDVRHLEAVLYTHEHYDHIAGFDDLRAFQFLKQKSPICFASPETARHIKHTFNYAFGAASQAGGGLPKVEIIEIDKQPFKLFGLLITPIQLFHGTLSIFGFRIGDFAYLTDCSAIPEASFPLLENLDTLVLDGLRPTPHPTHLSIPQAIELSKRIHPRITYLTHINHEVMHETIERTLPENVHLGFDALTFEIDASALG
jgi:phosphoribosyl 1,2-cyclic phosphate phosphodiesterase